MRSIPGPPFPATFSPDSFKHSSLLYLLNVSRWRRHPVPLEAFQLLRHVPTKDAVLLVPLVDIYAKIRPNDQEDSIEPFRIKVVGCRISTSTISRYVF
jgi:hypothetical protein